jgi:general secretion pathway protein G
MRPAFLTYRRALVGGKRARGFTLIEMMVVMLIIGVMAAMIVPNLIGQGEGAKVTAAKADISTIMGALNLYKLDNSRYPTTEQGLQSLVSKPTAGPTSNGWKGYLPKLPKDPWGNPYQYLYPGVHGEIDVFSYGADGQPGGTGNDADIGSWE